ncbi:MULTISPECIES: S8 family peptidase [Olivibacter]|uniref:S8 family peptidase n=1 Tax=Olivibacter jilunii TaxID=985016 RepID=A0ABW6B8I6_9SPHI|nr:S8 family peptidase [Pseudosphingobacterium sp.]
MANKPHVKLNTNKQIEPPIVLKFNYGYGEDAREENADPNYFHMVETFRADLKRWNNDTSTRKRERNPDLKIPYHIDYIKIDFQSQYSLNEFFQSYYNYFGLEAVQVCNFGTTVLFAIISDRFQDFLASVQGFIYKESKQNSQASYSSNILFVRSFQLLTSDDILQASPEPLMNFRLTRITLEEEKKQTILAALKEYLTANQLLYSLDEATENLEVSNLNEHQLQEIVKNYDIIFQVTSSLATLVRPNQFNLVERSYGFEISNTNGDRLPLIGIIDTGVSAKTPLAPLVIADEDLNLTSEPVNADEQDGGRGHGTAVAALAALGKKPYAQSYKGRMVADAKILPIKTLSAAGGYISQNQVLEKLRLAKMRYPELKIFTLTIGYRQHKKYNEDYSTYAYALDQFSYENDCLIFISSGNNGDAIMKTNGYHIPYFDEECMNLCVPGESMNNVTVGAASYSLKNGAHHGISNGKEYPTIYSRKGHIAFHLLPNGAKVNRSLFKPDFIECGGDYGYDKNGRLTDVGPSCLDLLSANPTESFYEHMGTSFSAPLAANVAVQIQKQYPSLKAASIKALLVNSSSDKLIDLQSIFQHNVLGHGLLDEEKAVFSNENRLTIVVEETIDSGKLKVIPINFPAYLTQRDLGKKNGILLITATLCFQFKPVLENQQGYCPLHMAFGFFKNQSGTDILAKEKHIRSRIKVNRSMWSQNGRDVSKPIPYTNVQKISFPVNMDELVKEQSTFKLAVHCRVHPQLRPGQEDYYLRDNLFSIAITIEEMLKENKLTGDLYNDMIAANETIAISEAFGEAEVETEG